MTVPEIRADMTLYLAGPMRGFPGWNWPAFDEYQTMLEDFYGIEVVSPANLDREAGIDYQDFLDQDGLKDCIERDVKAILDSCDGIVLMPGWKQSKGCAVEIALARFLGLAIYFAYYKLNPDNQSWSFYVSDRAGAAESMSRIGDHTPPWLPLPEETQTETPSA